VRVCIGKMCNQYCALSVPERYSKHGGFTAGGKKTCTEKWTKGAKSDVGSRTIKMRTPGAGIDDEENWGMGKGKRVYLREGRALGVNLVRGSRMFLHRSLNVVRGQEKGEKLSKKRKSMCAKRERDKANSAKRDAWLRVEWKTGK